MVMNMTRLAPGVSDEPVEPILDWISPRACAKILGYNLNTIYNWIERGIGPPFYTFNGMYRYRESEVHKWIAERRQ